jgi:RNA polymerase sigma-70 factor (ECF subfamily)
VDKQGPDNQERTDDEGRFVELLTGAQQQLHAYILCALGPDSGIDDVLQSTNVDLWKKRNEYDPERPFMAWAYRFAYFRLLDYRKQQARSRLLFDDSLIDTVHDHFLQSSRYTRNLSDALSDCMTKLTPEQADLLAIRYKHGHSLVEIAARAAKSPGSIAKRLFRIRRSLLDCIERTVAKEAT